MSTSQILVQNREFKVRNGFEEIRSVFSKSGPLRICTNTLA